MLISEYPLRKECGESDDDMGTHGGDDGSERAGTRVSYPGLYIRQHQAHERSNRKLSHLLSIPYSVRKYCSVTHRAREEEEPPFAAELEDAPREE